MSQPGIIAPVPRVGRVLTFSLQSASALNAALARLAEREFGDVIVFGVGPEVFSALNVQGLSLSAFPVIADAKVDVPCTQQSAVLILRGEDSGELLVLGNELIELLAPAFSLTEAIDTFKYRDSRDLTGYKDGTENPEDRAAEVAYLEGNVPGVSGGSYLVVNRWEHDLARFSSFSTQQKDDTIGRRLSDDEEFEEAPETAHVKRTAQESFEPEAFLLRRSSPYSLGASAGLVFLAYANSQQPFAQILKRMVGAEDGVVDALFSFSKSVTGSSYFCPPLKDGKLDLRALLG